MTAVTDADLSELREHANAFLPSRGWHLLDLLFAERDALRASIASAREAHGDPLGAAVLDIVRCEAADREADLIAAWCDRMGWDHTGDLIRDREHRTAAGKDGER